MSDEEKVDVTNEEDQMQIMMQPDADTVLVAESDLAGLDSPKALAIADFDDSKIKILGHREIPMAMRSQRGKAGIVALLENLYVVPGLNARLPTQEWEDHIEWLTGQIIAEGFREDCPLLVFPTIDASGQQKYGIISGESRYQAALRAAKRGFPITSVPIVLSAEGLSMEDMSVQLATSNSGKPFTPIELSYLAQRFSKWGRDVPEIAKILKFSENYIQQLLRIARAPNKVREMIKSGAVSFQSALVALNKDSTTAVEQLEKSVAMAKAAGKTRVTSKFLPEKQAQKASRTFAPEMHSFLQKLRNNEGMMGLLDDEDRVEIENLLGKIDEIANATPESIAKSKAEAAAKKQASQEARAQKKADKVAKDAERERKKADKLAKEAEAARKKAEKEAKKQAEAAAKKESAKAKPAAKATPKPAAKVTSKPETRSSGTSTTTTRIKDGAATVTDDDDVQQHPAD